MAAPVGYDLGLTHATVNGGTATGYLLAEADGDSFVEEQALVADVQVTTGGAVSVASYGAGATIYRLRLALRTDILRRDHRPATETPDTLRARLKSYAAIADGQLRLDTATLSRRVAAVEQLKFISAPGIDGYVAILALVDIGA